MIELPVLVQWMVVVQLLTTGRLAPLNASEELCRSLARDVRSGEHIIGTIDGREEEMVFLECVLTVNGVVVEIIESKKD